MQAIYTLCILHVLVGDDLTTASAPNDYEPCIIVQIYHSLVLLLAQEMNIM